MGQNKERFMEERETPTNTMYNIRQQNLTLMSFIQDADGEITEEQLQELSINKDQFEQKAINYGFAIRKLEADADIIAAEIKRLQARKAAYENKANKLREVVLAAMNEFQVDKVQDQLLTLSIRKSFPVELSDTCTDDILSYCIPAVLNIDELIIDKADAAGITEDVLSAFDLKVTLNKTRVAALIKEGIKFPGAAIGENKSLQIK